MASRFLTSSGRHLASCAMPPLPGAQATSLTRGDCSSFQTSECSRPPPPNTRTLPAIGETYRVENPAASCKLRRCGGVDPPAEIPNEAGTFLLRKKPSPQRTQREHEGEVQAAGATIKSWAACD